ncbi:MAG: TetR family transcriptional regulator, partial [Spirochaetales bacterium]|nr:TetR family transcriptional regulator [Spirochaetales bacterium]
MPRTATISKKDIIDAAIELIRKNGYEAVNARALACKLRCSTQP